jgi:hypothetical protein
MMRRQTRGERSNNPMNLRDFGIGWQGLDDPPHDAQGYCRFHSAAMGIRAGARDLHTIWAAGRQTVAAIIGHYAPPSENDTAAYIRDVAAKLAVAPDDSVDLGDAARLQAFVTAIICHENGRCIYDAEFVAAAVKEALPV